MSAFFFWMAENRDKLKKPGMGVADVAKAAGAEWGKMTDKVKWEKKAEEDKKRYEKDIAAYKDSTGYCFIFSCSSFWLCFAKGVEQTFRFDCLRLSIP
jgi:hypothetical protein